MACWLGSQAARQSRSLGRPAPASQVSTRSVPSQISHCCAASNAADCTLPTVLEAKKCESFGFEWLIYKRIQSKIHAVITANTIDSSIKYCVCPYHEGQADFMNSGLKAIPFQ